MPDGMLNIMVINQQLSNNWTTLLSTMFDVLFYFDFD